MTEDAVGAAWELVVSGCVIGCGMRIAEMFYSVQGEGKLTGVPSFFIRTSGCNLRCRWCDTPYASWQPEGREMSTEEIVAGVRKTPARHVVVTGGEPMLAKSMPELLAQLKEQDYHITIETAGTILPDGVACDLASLSPKLAHSTPDAEMLGEGWRRKHEELRWQPEVVRAWVQNYEHQLKFVVSREADLAEIEVMLQEAGINGVTQPANVMLMPEGRTVEEIAKLAPQVVEWCKDRGWRYCARLHIDLFGNKRGT